MPDTAGGFLRRPKLNDRPQARINADGPAPMVVTGPPVDRAQRAARSARRSADILESLHRLDTAPSPQAQREIIAWLDEVYASRQGGTLLGLFGHCYLGAPYVDHAFSMTGDILDHYTPDSPVPHIYQAARPFAISTAYAFIEIYSDGQIIPVRPDGTGAA